MATFVVAHPTGNYSTLIDRRGCQQDLRFYLVSPLLTRVHPTSTPGWCSNGMHTMGYSFTSQVSTGSRPGPKG
jgi:hypothetical protein